MEEGRGAQIFFFFFFFKPAIKTCARLYRGLFKTVRIPLSTMINNALFFYLFWFCFGLFVLFSVLFLVGFFFFLRPASCHRHCSLAESKRCPKPCSDAAKQLVKTA